MTKQIRIGVAVTETIEVSRWGEIVISVPEFATDEEIQETVAEWLRVMGDNAVDWSCRRFAESNEEHVATYSSVDDPLEGNGYMTAKDEAAEVTLEYDSSGQLKVSEGRESESESGYEFN